MFKYVQIHEYNHMHVQKINRNKICTCGVHLKLDLKLYIIARDMKFNFLEVHAQLHYIDILLTMQY